MSRGAEPRVARSIGLANRAILTGMTPEQTAIDAVLRSGHLTAARLAEAQALAARDLGADGRPPSLYGVIRGRFLDAAGVATLDAAYQATSGADAAATPRAHPDEPSPGGSVVAAPPRRPWMAASQSSAGDLARIGDYQVTREIARGGMGIVYAARSAELDRDVAIKVLIAGAAASDDDIERFHIEARAAARLRHPNIIAIHQVGTDGGRPFFVMDLIEGPSLAERLRDGPLAPREAAELTRKLALALRYAHERAILHRDIKPANVLIDESGEPILTDFGLAKDIRPDQRQLTVTGEILGTPAYMSPEQAESRFEQIDRRSDVYSLGATLYALLCGRAPFKGVSALNVLAMVIRKEPERPSKLRPDLDRDLETIVLRCLEKEPTERYQTAGGLADDLQRWLRDEPILARAPSLADRARKWVRRNRVVATVIATAGALLLIGTVGAVLWNVAATESARALERAVTVGTARGEADLAWAALEKTPLPADLEQLADDEQRRLLDARTALALAAHGAAQRWHALDAADDAARNRRFEAALELAAVARRSEQWIVATRACDDARSLGVADEQAEAELAAVAAARDAEARRREKIVSDLLDAAADGDLRRRHEGITEAVFEIVRFPDRATVELLTSRLEILTVELRAIERELWLEAAEPDDAERANGGRPLEGLRGVIDRMLALPPDEPLGAADAATVDSARDRLVARRQRSGDGHVPPRFVEITAGARQRRRLGIRADLAKLCCEALGRLGVARGAVEPLAAFLAAARDEAIAAPAAAALGRLGGDRALRILAAALRRFEVRGRVAVAARPFLADIGAATDADDLDELVARGELWIEQGDGGRGRSDFEAALALDARHARAWLGLGRAGNLERRFIEAIGALDQAIEIDPHLAEAYRERAIVRWRATNDRVGALADFATAIELAPRDPENLIQRAQLHMRTGEHAAAANDAGAAIGLVPESAVVWSLRGAARRELGDREAARADLDRAVELDPGNADVLCVRGVILTELGELGAALADLDRAIELDPSVALFFENRGDAHRKGGDLVSAAEDYGQAVAIAPRRVEAWVELTRCNFLVRDLRRCVETANAALELDPDLVGALCWRGRAHADLGRPDLALADLDRAVLVDPGDADAWHHRAVVRKLVGRLRDALGDLDRTLELDPRHGYAWDERGDVRRLLGDLDGARADCDRAVALSPKFERAWNNRALVRHQSGDLEGAIEDLGRAIELNPRFALAVSNRSAIRMQLGDREGALADAELAIELAPRMAGAWLGRGMLRERIGDRDGAASDLRRAIELAPGSAEATMARKALERLDER